MEVYSDMVKFFVEGGAFMYPILVVFALGLAVAGERWVYLTLSSRSNQTMWAKLTPLLQKSDFQQVMAVSANAKSDISKIIVYGLSRLKASKRRDDIEMAMEEGLMEVIPRLERRTHYLATLANIATLLGLLGTIVGLIQAFNAVAHANPADKADLLSSSISVAMNTTAFGLIAAIPLLLMYSVLQSKTTQLVDSMEMATVKFLNIITEAFAERAASAEQKR